MLIGQQTPRDMRRTRAGARPLSVFKHFAFLLVAVLILSLVLSPSPASANRPQSFTEVGGGSGNNQLQQVSDGSTASQSGTSPKTKYKKCRWVTVKIKKYSNGGWKKKRIKKC